jgi:hypothetical protein
MRPHHEPDRRQRAAAHVRGPHVVATPRGHWCDTMKRRAGAEATRECGACTIPSEADAPRAGSIFGFEIFPAHVE